jgi:hypothetical protein
VGEWTSLRQEGWVPPRGSVALAEMASWRPQTVVADAKVSSPLGKYLTKLLGPPSLRVDDVIAWRNPVFTGYQAPPGLRPAPRHTPAHKARPHHGKSHHR